MTMDHPFSNTASLKLEMSTLDLHRPPSKALKAVSTLNPLNPLSFKSGVDQNHQIESKDWIDSNHSIQSMDSIHGMSSMNGHLPSWMATFVPPQSLAPKQAANGVYGNPSSPSFCVDQSRHEAMVKLCEILPLYARDIEYSVKHGLIEGVVFMNDHHDVFFLISIREKADGKEAMSPMNEGPKSKITFVRKSGNCLSFAQFWGDIKRTYLRPRWKRNTQERSNGGWTAPRGSPPDLDASSLPPLPGRPGADGMGTMGQSAWTELEEFSADLNANDQYQADFMRIFCHSKLGRTVRERDILRHDKTVRALMDCAVNRWDIVVVRGALLILTAVIEKCTSWEAMRAFMRRHGLRLMRIIILNLNSQSVLMQKHAIRLLSALSTFSGNVDWDGVFKAFGDGLSAKRELATSCRQFEARWKALGEDEYHRVRGDGLEQAMFEKIRRHMFR